MSLAKLVLYSMECRREISKIIDGRTAYLVPGSPSVDDLKICARMEICLYSGNPSLT